MNNTILTRLALAGIASGMLAVTACNEAAKVEKVEKVEKAENAQKASGSAAVDAGAKTPGDSLKSAEQGCKGLNACKGQGGCHVSEADLKIYAAKAGIPLEKAGKPHGCKGRNECKGLGGCKH